MLFRIETEKDLRSQSVVIIFAHKPPPPQLDLIYTTMHLLPHKSWNPYSQKNIDKVRKDEREHEKKTLEEKKRKLGYVRKYSDFAIYFRA